MTDVRKCIADENDEMEFVNKCGISVEAFLEILSFYTCGLLLSNGMKSCTYKDLEYALVQWWP